MMIDVELFEHNITKLYSNKLNLCHTEGGGGRGGGQKIDKFAFRNL